MLWNQPVGRLDRNKKYFVTMKYLYSWIYQYSSAHKVRKITKLLWSLGFQLELEAFRSEQYSWFSEFSKVGNSTLKFTMTNRLFSYSDKESESNNILIHFVEFLNMLNSDRSNATWSNATYENVSKWRLI